MFHSQRYSILSDFLTCTCPHDCTCLKINHWRVIFSIFFSIWLGLKLSMIKDNLLSYVYLEKFLRQNRYIFLDLYFLHITEALNYQWYKLLFTSLPSIYHVIGLQVIQKLRNSTENSVQNSNVYYCSYLLFSLLNVKFLTSRFLLSTLP